MLRFTTREDNGVLVVAFEATDENVGEWQTTHRDLLYRLIETRPDGRVALDLSDVNYLASSEIGFLVTIKRRLDRRQGRLVLFGVGPYIQEIFQTMNLVKILDIAPDFTQALARLGDGKAGK